jgi:hypothetical protein
MNHASSIRISILCEEKGGQSSAKNIYQNFNKYITNPQSSEKNDFRHGRGLYKYHPMRVKAMKMPARLLALTIVTLFVGSVLVGFTAEMNPLDTGKNA